MNYTSIELDLQGFDSIQIKFKGFPKNLSEAGGLEEYDPEIAYSEVLMRDDDLIKLKELLDKYLEDKSKYFLSRAKYSTNNSELKV